MVQHWHVFHDLADQRARQLRLEAECERLARQLPRRPSALRLALAGACRVLAHRLEQPVAGPAPQEHQPA
jgi:hypothetical protein